MALQRFSRRIGEAANGTGELTQTMEALGIPLRDNEGVIRSTEEVLGDYADAIQNAESDQEALRLAFKGFDSEGAALVNTLRNGEEGLNDLRDAAREAGVVLEEDLVRSLEAAQSASDRIALQIQVAWTRAIGNIAVAIAGTETELINVQLRQIAERFEFLDEQVRKFDEAGPFVKWGFPIREVNEEISDLIIREAELRNELELLTVTQDQNTISITGQTDAVGAQVTALTDWEKKVKELNANPPKFLGPVTPEENPIVESASLATDAWDTAADNISNSMAQAAASGKLSFKDLIRSILADLTKLAVSKAFVTVFGAIAGGFVGGGAPSGGFAPGGGAGGIIQVVGKGAAYKGSDIFPLARGGVISSPTLLAGGAAIGGEAGAEGVLPLRRTASGDLGVIATGAGSTFAPTVNVNMAGGSGEDGAETGRRIGNEITRQLRQMWRAQAVDERRVGGVLNPVM
jgi:hypothetical protein